MSKIIFSILFIVINLQVFEFQSVRTGKCPSITSVDNFNIRRFSGLWYDISNVPISGLKLNKCVTAFYNIDWAGVVRISVGYYDGQQYQQMNDAFRISNSSGVWNLNLAMIRSNIEFGVIDTDYDTFGVAYGCARLLNMKVEIAWIVSRQPTLSKDLIKRATDALKQQKLPTKQLKAVNHNNCPRT